MKFDVHWPASLTVWTPGRIVAVDAGAHVGAATAGAAATSAPAATTAATSARGEQQISRMSPATAAARRPCGPFVAGITPLVVEQPSSAVMRPLTVSDAPLGGA